MGPYGFQNSQIREHRWFIGFSKGFHKECSDASKGCVGFSGRAYKEHALNHIPDIQIFYGPRHIPQKQGRLWKRLTTLIAYNISLRQSARFRVGLWP